MISQFSNVVWDMISESPFVNVLSITYDSVTDLITINTDGNHNFNVGDILTVTFNEIFAATKAATAASSKADAFAVTLPTGLPNIVTGGFATDDSGVNGGGLTAGTNRTFSGAGNAAQSNSFTGSLAVTVTRVFPNGNMEVAGQKEITLNNGNEYVRVKGIVRPEDISATNVVSSTRLADAQIRYTGSGHLADASKPGWLSQFMRAISPF